MKIDNFFAELKRRNVYKVAVAYAVAGWALSQGIAQVFPVFDVPNWVIRLIVVLIIIGFPVAVVFAWVFQLDVTEFVQMRLPKTVLREIVGHAFGDQNVPSIAAIHHSLRDIDSHSSDI